MTHTTESVRDWPAYWFVALERAERAGDSRAATAARHELRRLGYTVERLGSRAAQTREGVADAS